MFSCIVFLCPIQDKFFCKVYDILHEHTHFGKRKDEKELVRNLKIFIDGRNVRIPFDITFASWGTLIKGSALNQPVYLSFSLTVQSYKRRWQLPASKRQFSHFWSILPNVSGKETSVRPKKATPECLQSCQPTVSGSLEFLSVFF